MYASNSHYRIGTKSDSRSIQGASSGIQNATGPFRRRDGVTPEMKLRLKKTAFRRVSEGPPSAKSVQSELLTADEVKNGRIMGSKDLDAYCQTIEESSANAVQKSNAVKRNLKSQFKSTVENPGNSKIFDKLYKQREEQVKSVLSKSNAVSSSESKYTHSTEEKRSHTPYESVDSSQYEKSSAYLSQSERQKLIKQVKKSVMVPLFREE